MYQYAELDCLRSYSLGNHWDTGGYTILEGRNPPARPLGLFILLGWENVWKLW